MTITERNVFPRFFIVLFVYLTRAVEIVEIKWGKAMRIVVSKFKIFLNVNRFLLANVNKREVRLVFLVHTYVQATCTYGGTFIKWSATHSKLGSDLVMINKIATSNWRGKKQDATLVRYVTVKYIVFIIWKFFEMFLSLKVSWEVLKILIQKPNNDIGFR